MQELSLNVLDVAQNSVSAGATLIQIEVDIDTARKRMTISIEDNGRGMDDETQKRVCDPFYTTRTTRKVGLGLPFFKLAAEQAGGGLTIRSALGKGTRVEAVFRLGHIDLAPLGDMASTVANLIQCDPDIDFLYTIRADGEAFCLDTRQLREMLGEVSLAEAQIALFIQEYIRENSIHLQNRSTQL